MKAYRCSRCGQRPQLLKRRAAVDGHRYYSYRCQGCGARTKGLNPTAFDAKTEWNCGPLGPLFIKRFLATGRRTRSVPVSQRARQGFFRPVLRAIKKLFPHRTRPR
jgi:DNA-directed RNA polymerase subunit RPC12/RpoP